MLNLDRNKKYILACSYGPDSMALLDMLIKEKFDFVVAHVCYNLRNEAKDETNNLITYCNEKKVKLFYIDIPQGSICKNVEETCREIRYTYFAKLSKQLNIDSILVAHNLDDNLETYLMQNSRHLQPKYWGIAGKTEIKGVEILRPLLNYRKSVLLEYCLKNNVPFAIDKSNFDTSIKRNYFRHKIISKMSDNDIKCMLNKISELNGELEKMKHSINIINTSSIRDLLSLDSKTLAFCLNEKIKNIDPKMSVSASFSNEICKLLNSRKSNVKILIKNNVFAVKSYDSFSFIKENIFSFEYVLIEHSKLFTPFFRCDFTKNCNGRNIKPDDFPIIIRNIHENDMIPVANYLVPARRKMINEKIPLNLRKRWPVILNKNGEIIYSPRYRKEFKADEECNFYVI